MNSPKMTDMGMKRKDMRGPESVSEPGEKKDYDNEVCYPCLSASGEQARMLGAEDLKEGETIEQLVRWKVRRVERSEVNGKKDYRLELDMVKASDVEACKDCEDDAEDGEYDGKHSAGIAALMAKARSDS